MTCDVPTTYEPSAIMKRAVLFYFVFSLIFHVNCKLFPFMVRDIMKYYGKSTMASEFSCNKRESVHLLKVLTKEGFQSNVLHIDVQILPYPIPPHHILFVLNLHCKNAITLIRRADEEKLFLFPYKWLFHYKSTTNFTIGRIITTYFSDVNILVDGDVTVAELQKNNSYVLRKIFRRHTNSFMDIEEMGYWTEKDGLHDEIFEKNIAKRRKNLMGTVLNTCIVITHNDSLNHLTDKRFKHIDSIAKVNYVLVEHLSDIVNATLKYSIKDTWGYKNDKSEWSGMIGELTRKEADIGGTALFLTSDRVDIIDYIAMTTPTRSKFVFRQPKLSYVTNVYTLPFDTKVWISTIALVIIIDIVMYIVIKWEWHKKLFINKKIVYSEGEVHDTVSDVAFLSFSAVCQQGVPSIPFCLPARITALFLFLSLMFLYVSYSANIVALLQSSSTSIQSLEDLLKSRLQVGVDDTVFNHFYFPNATEPIRRAIYLTKVAPPGQKSRFMPIEEGVKKLRQGLFAFHMETGAGYKIVSETFHEDEKCGLQEIQYLQVPDPWLAIQKNSSYKKMLKIGLRLIQESGIQFREVGLIYTKKPICISRGSSFISVSLVDCYPAAVVLAGGLIISGIIFLVEVYIHNRKRFYEKGKTFILDTKIAGSMQEPVPFIN